VEQISKIIKNHLSKKLVAFIFSLTSVIICVFMIYIFFYKKQIFLDRNPASYALYTDELESQADKIMEESRRLHVIKDYSIANELLSELLKKYHYTGHREEASFLLAKGFFYEGEYGRSEEVIKELLEYAPQSDSKWLGYALLVQGKIYELRDRKDEAIKLYRRIVTEFTDAELVNEAEDLLLDIGL